MLDGPGLPSYYISEIDENLALFVLDEGLGIPSYVKDHNGLRDAEQGCAARGGVIGCLREHGIGMEDHLKFLTWVSNSVAEWLDISHRLSCAIDHDE